MTTTFNFDLDVAFQLGETQLRSLERELDESSYDIRIVAGCLDSASRRFSSIDELLAYENNGSRRITSLYLSQSISHEKERPKLNVHEFNVHFSSEKNQQSGNISYEVEGEEDIAVAKQERLQSVLSGTKPWFSWITQLDKDYMHLILFIGPYMLLVIIASIYVTLMVLLGGEPSPASEPEAGAADDPSSVYGEALFVTVAVLYTLVLLALARVRRYLFPAGVFLIGQEIAQNNRRQLLRRWTLGLAGSAVLALLFSIYGFG